MGVGASLRATASPCCSLSAHARITATGRWAGAIGNARGPAVSLAHWTTLPGNANKGEKGGVLPPRASAQARALTPQVDSHMPGPAIGLYAARFEPLEAGASFAHRGTPVPLSLADALAPPQMCHRRCHRRRLELPWRWRMRCQGRARGHPASICQWACRRQACQPKRATQACRRGPFMLPASCPLLWTRQPWLLRLHLVGRRWLRRWFVGGGFGFGSGVSPSLPPPLPLPLSMLLLLLVLLPGLSLPPAKAVRAPAL